LVSPFAIVGLTLVGVFTNNISPFWSYDQQLAEARKLVGENTNKGGSFRFIEHQTGSY